MSTHLFKAESRRLVKRRFVRCLAIGGVVVLVAILAGVFLTNQGRGPAQFAAAEAKAEANYQEQVGFFAQERTACEQAKASGTADADMWPGDCADITPPSRENFSASDYLPPTFEFRPDFEALLIPFAAILALVGFIVGASFVGAEWNSGGMMNLLLWRPQRLKVFGAKLAALLTGVTALTIGAAALWTASLWLTATLRGTTEKMTPGVWQSFGLTGLRGLVMVLAATTIGFGLASLGRHTAVALGVAAGIGVVAQFGIGIVLSLAEVRFAEAWLIPTYLLAWMTKTVKLEDYESCNFSLSGECTPATFEITWPVAGGLLAASVVLVLGAAMWTMRSRDVT
ncbi:MAG TPA: ABC transporter permease subunit [Actinoplanes sp.]|nr:ABC transporter permease subunit [Actinoplanes sp.]